MSNNSGLTKDTSAPSGEVVYQSTTILNRYNDPKNPNTKTPAKIITKVNIKSGDIDIFESVAGALGSSRLVPIKTIKADGSKPVIQNSTKNQQFFSKGSSNTLSQENQLINTTKTDALVVAKQVLSTSEADALAKTQGYQSIANNSSADPNANVTQALSQSNSAYAQVKNAVPRGRTTAYRYPQEIPELGYDFIRIKSYKYKAGGREALKLGTRKSAKERLIQNNEVQETVILPMQPNFSESNAVSWGGDNINPFQMMGAQFAEGAIKAIGNILTPEKAGNIIGDTFKTLGDDVRGIIDDSASGRALVAYFAGQAVGVNVLGRSAGVTLNPNLELLFNGPNLRTFSFNFRFTPRSKKESEEVREIIRVFKKNMAVQRSDSNLFLLTPNIFTLEYIYNAQGNNAGQIHPYLNIFKPMAMTNLNVNYTPDGSYMTYDETGSLTQYDLQMSFGEIEPIYADEYGDEDNSLNGNFNEPINMGY
tara:strand:+ start:266 stop:1702 length:1437 start_codon:yes stop_codon:yes gene_type:complete